MRDVNKNLKFVTLVQVGTFFKSYIYTG